MVIHEIDRKDCVMIIVDQFYIFGKMNDVSASDFLPSLNFDDPPTTPVNLRQKVKNLGSCVTSHNVTRFSAGTVSTRSVIMVGPSDSYERSRFATKVTGLESLFNVETIIPIVDYEFFYETV